MSQYNYNNELYVHFSICLIYHIHILNEKLHIIKQKNELYVRKYLQLQSINYN